jgi:hypothetical protein
MVGSQGSASAPGDRVLFGDVFPRHVTQSPWLVPFGRLLGWFSLARLGTAPVASTAAAVDTPRTGRQPRGGSRPSAPEATVRPASR